MTHQVRQDDWYYQWSQFRDDDERLFLDWIYPAKLEDFQDKTVLDGGCGGGDHMMRVAPYAREVVGVDLNCAELAAANCASLANVSVVGGDVARIELGRQFEIVYSIGTLHHTDNPRASFENLARHVRPGGRMIVWVYSYEGNFLNRAILEPVKRLLLAHLPKGLLLALSYLVTAGLYVPVYTLYLLPLRALPYYEYFRNFRRLAFRRNVLNVFDKLNAPQTAFLRRSEIQEWFAGGFRDVHISSYVGVSWRASGTRWQGPE